VLDGVHVNLFRRELASVNSVLFLFCVVQTGGGDGDDYYIEQSVPGNPAERHREDPQGDDRRG